MIDFLDKKIFSFSKLLLFFLCFWISTNSFSQNSSGCLSNNQLVTISQGTISEISSLLNKEKWLLISNESNVPLVIGQDSIDFNLAIWQYSMGYEETFVYLYYHNKISNYIEYKTNESCYNNLIDYCKLNYKTDSQKFSENNIVHINFLKSNSLNIIFSKTNDNYPRYSIYYCNKNQIDSLINVKKSIRLKAEEEAKERLTKVIRGIAISDSLHKLDMLDEALSSLESIFEIIPSFDKQIEMKMDYLKSEIILKEISLLTSEGEQLFAKRDLVAAKNKFKKILLLDSKNETAKKRISQIDKMLDVLSSRSLMMYDYEILNPDAYQNIHRELCEKLNYNASQYPKGQLNFNFNILFDTAGNNLTFYEILNSSISQFNVVLSSLAQNSLLEPTQKEGILVSSKSFIPVNLNWDTREVEIKKKKTKFIINPRNGFGMKEDLISEYLADSTMPRGRYYFDVKNKTLNSGMQFSDIKLKKYKTTGPEAALYSMLMPGAGTMAATQGRKGYAAMSTFLIFGAGSLVCWYYSDKLSDNPTTTDKAKWLKYGSYACVGVAGVIYISDVINAFVKGIKNMKNSKALRKSLKEGGIEVSKENITIDL